MNAKQSTGEEEMPTSGASTQNASKPRRERFLDQEHAIGKQACAIAHLKAVEDDIDALNELRESSEFHLSDEQLASIERSRAVILEILPAEKAQRVRIALDKGFLLSKKVLDNNRTYISERPRRGVFNPLANLFVPSVELYKVLKD